MSTLAWGEHFGGNNTDLFLAGTSNTSLFSHVYEHPSSLGNDGKPQLAASFEGVEFASAAFGDVYNDERLELAVMGRNSANQTLTRIYSWEPNSYTDTGASIIGLYKGDLGWADFDGDGDLDLAIAGYSAADEAYTRIYQNVNSGNNEPPDPPTKFIAYSVS